MKNFDKITLSIGQLNRLVSEAYGKEIDGFDASTLSKLKKLIKELRLTTGNEGLDADIASMTSMIYKFGKNPNEMPDGEKDDWKFLKQDFDKSLYKYLQISEKIKEFIDNTDLSIML